VLDTATAAIILGVIVHPIVFVNISSLGCGNVHTIETQALPIVEDLGTGLCDVGTPKLVRAATASTLRNDALPVDEASAFDDCLVRSGVHCVKRPDLCHLDALDVLPK